MTHLTNKFPWLLFHPNIPKPLHGLAPRIVLGEKWWNETKKEAKEKFNQHCWACGIHKNKATYHNWLEAHECYSINYSIGQVKYVGTCALCHACHNYIHDGRMQILTNKGDFELEKYGAIIKHGETILQNWFESKGWQWKGYKRTFDLFCPHYELYPDLPKFSHKIEWLKGKGKADWNDYHLIVEGKRYEVNHKSYEDWLSFYQS